MKTLTTTAVLAGFLAASAHLSAGALPDDMIIVRDSGDAPAELATKIRTYTEDHEDWLFLTEFPLKAGEVTILKVCYPPMGRDFFAAGLHVSAMLPCGNMAIYEEEGGTRLALLHPRFMTTLYPDPNVERAVATAEPAFQTLLDAILD
jgi:hypothetical protein